MFSRVRDQGSMIFPQFRRKNHPRDRDRFPPRRKRGADEGYKCPRGDLRCPASATTLFASKQEHDFSAISAEKSSARPRPLYCGSRNSLFAIRSQNFDRCYSLASLDPPPAAVGSLPRRGGAAELTRDISAPRGDPRCPASATRPIAVPEILCSLYAHRISTAATPSPPSIRHRRRSARSPAAAEVRRRQAII